jgi:hypothetical protein
MAENYRARWNRIFSVGATIFIKEGRLPSRPGNMTAGKPSFLADKMQLRFDFFDELLRSASQPDC